ncbi:MAG: terminase small subunit [Paracoccaceae bacterium]
MKILSELALEGKPVHSIEGPDLRELLDISPAALSDLCNRGLAVKLGHNHYDLEETVRRYTVHLRGIASARGGEDHVQALTTERARLAKEQADAQSLKNAERRGELLSAQSVASGWVTILTGLRARLMALPARLRADLPHLSPSDVEVIDRELRNCLTELADDADD